jgi:TonB family protein
VTVSADGRYFIDGTPAQVERLEQELAQALVAAKSDTLLLRADKLVPEATRADIMAMARRVAANVAILTNPPAPGATVRGSLDKDVLRRVVREHMNDVKACYEQELPTNPSVGGRIVVQFTIAATGQVVASVLQESTMGNPRVESCVVQSVRRWEFPKPQGDGAVVVSYPFMLTPAGH